MGWWWYVHTGYVSNSQGDRDIRSIWLSSPTPLGSYVCTYLSFCSRDFKYSYTPTCSGSTVVQTRFGVCTWWRFVTHECKPVRGLVSDVENARPGSRVTDIITGRRALIKKESTNEYVCYALQYTGGSHWSVIDGKLIGS